jgi:hypothetical protein
METLPINEPISSYEMMNQELGNILEKFDLFLEQDNRKNSESYNEAFLTLLDELSRL